MTMAAEQYELDSTSIRSKENMSIKIHTRLFIKINFIYIN